MNDLLIQSYVPELLNFLSKFIMNNYTFFIKNSIKSMTYCKV